MARRSEPDYLAIAKKKVHRPAKRQSWRKALVYGRNKKGKTRFSLSNGIDRTLHIDPEQGTDTMKTLNPYVWPITSWKDMNEAWGAIRTYQLSPYILGQGKSKEPFDTIAVDGCTKINNLALKHVGRIAEQRDLDRIPGMTDRRDYNKSGELMKDMINGFLNLRMNVIFTAQERMITSTPVDEADEGDDEQLYFVPDLPAGVRGALNSVVDVIGRIYVVKVEIKGETKTRRRLQIGHHELYDTGYRSDFELPDVLKNPTFPKLVNLIETGDASGS
jgi:hypothetical protein